MNSHHLIRSNSLAGMGGRPSITRTVVLTGALPRRLSKLPPPARSDSTGGLSNTNEGSTATPTCSPMGQQLSHHNRDINPTLFPPRGSPPDWTLPTHPGHYLHQDRCPTSRTSPHVERATRPRLLTTDMGYTRRSPNETRRGVWSCA